MILASRKFDDKKSLPEFEGQSQDYCTKFELKIETNDKVSLLKQYLNQIQFWKSETGQAHSLQIKLLCKIKDDLNSILN